jgi:type IV pilus assembly protein PilB
MTNRELLTSLTEAGLVSSGVGEKLLQEAESLNRPFEDLLYARNVVPEVEVAKAKSKLLKIPYRAVEAESIPNDILRVIPQETAVNYRVVPLSRTKDMFVVGMVHPDNPAAQEALRFLGKQLKLSLGVYLITPSDANEVLARFSSVGEEVQAALKMVKPGEGLSAFQRITKLEEGSGTSSSDAPVIRIVASLLKEAVRMQASDIHIEPERTKTRVRFRLDGKLEDHVTLPPELAQSLVSRIKVLSNLRLDETRIPQDGRFRTVIFEKEIDFRVSVFPTSSGEKAALRVLDSAVGLRSLEDIGVTGESAKILEAGIAKPYGMVLLTGPTGSGKTTTLYALMRILNRDEVNVISLEDPVEYTIEGVNQSQVRPEIGYDFASGLRQILRQDPDVIMVGEIRDTETASLATNAALTGHIVLSTLHTNDAVGVIPRLIDMGVPPFLLSAGLNLMVAQRLLSRLCSVCRKPIEPVGEVRAAIERELGSMKPDVKSGVSPSYKVFRSPGCSSCKGKGVSGRIAIFEVFQMTQEVANLISEPGVTEGKLRDVAKRQGMVTLRQDGVLKALNGLVAIEEVLRETEEV